MAAGRGEVDIVDGAFALAGSRAFLTAHDHSIAEFRDRQSAAFAAERRAWDVAGEFRRAS